MWHVFLPKAFLNFVELQFHPNALEVDDPQSRPQQVVMHVHAFLPRVWFLWDLLNSNLVAVTGWLSSSSESRIGV
eukprot:1809441-Amphidinium_carterae.1